MEYFYHSFFFETEIKEKKSINKFFEQNFCEKHSKSSQQQHKA